MELNFFIFFTFFSFAQCKFSGLSCKQIRMFVDGHNSRRLMVAMGKLPGQPAAIRMNTLVWDEELSMKAQEWASYGLLVHNPDKSIPSKRFRTGENIYHSYTNHWMAWHVFDVDMATAAWFNEHRYYTYGPIAKTDYSRPELITGHYAQMVWADTAYIGCGILEEYENGVYYVHVVCNYGPPGNYLGRLPYEAGEPSNSLICADKENCKHIYGRKCS